MRTVNVLVADDQPEVRSAVRLIVEQLVGYRVAGEAADVAGLLRLAGELRPDVVLLDWELPGGGVFSAEEGWRRDALAALHATASETRVVALSVRPHAGPEAVAAGADAFVCKGDPPRRLIEALDGLL